MTTSGRSASITSCGNSLVQYCTQRRKCSANRGRNILPNESCRTTAVGRAGSSISVTKMSTCFVYGWGTCCARAGRGNVQSTLTCCSTSSRYMRVAHESPGRSDWRNVKPSTGQGSIDGTACASSVRIALAATTPPRLFQCVPSGK